MGRDEEPLGGKAHRRPQNISLPALGAWRCWCAVLFKLKTQFRFQLCILLLIRTTSAGTVEDLGLPPTWVLYILSKLLELQDQKILWEHSAYKRSHNPKLGDGLCTSLAYPSVLYVNYTQSAYLVQVANNLHSR